MTMQNFYNLFVHYYISKYIFSQCKVADVANRVKKISNICSRGTANFSYWLIKTNMISRATQVVSSVTGFYMLKYVFWCIHLSLCFNVNHVEEKQQTATVFFFVETAVPKVSEIFLECLCNFFSKYCLPLEITTAETIVLSYCSLFQTIYQNRLALPIQKKHIVTSNIKIVIHCKLHKICCLVSLLKRNQHNSCLSHITQDRFDVCMLRGKATIALFQQSLPYLKVANT